MPEFEHSPKSNQEIKNTSKKIRFLFIFLFAIFIGLIAVLVIGQGFFDGELEKLGVSRGVELVSDIPGVDVSLNNPKKLDEYLSQFGFWEESSVAILGPILDQTEKWVTVERLVVHFTLNEQANEHILSQGETIYSFGQQIENSTLHLYIQVKPPSEFGLEEKSKIADSLLIGDLYTITHHFPIENSQKRQESKLEILITYFENYSQDKGLVMFYQKQGYEFKETLRKVYSSIKTLWDESNSVYAQTCNGYCGCGGYNLECPDGSTCYGVGDDCVTGGKCAQVCTDWGGGGTDRSCSFKSTQAECNSGGCPCGGAECTIYYSCSWDPGVPTPTIPPPPNCGGVCCAPGDCQVGLGEPGDSACDAVLSGTLCCSTCQPPGGLLTTPTGGFIVWYYHDVDPSDGEWNPAVDIPLDPAVMANVTTGVTIPGVNSWSWTGITTDPAPLSGWDWKYRTLTGCTTDDNDYDGVHDSCEGIAHGGLWDVCPPIDPDGPGGPLPPGHGSGTCQFSYDSEYRCHCGGRVQSLFFSGLFPNPPAPDPANTVFDALILGPDCACSSYTAQANFSTIAPSGWLVTSMQWNGQSNDFGSVYGVDINGPSGGFTSSLECFNCADQIFQFRTRVVKVGLAPEQPPNCSLTLSDYNPIEGDNVAVNANVSVGTYPINKVDFWYRLGTLTYGNCGAGGWLGDPEINPVSDFASPYQSGLDTGSLTPGIHTIVANVKDDQTNYCTGNPGGTCGQKWWCEYCSAVIDIQCRPPIAPTNVDSTDGLSGSSCGSMIVTWTDNSDNEDGFKIYEDGVEIADVAAGTTTHTFAPTCDLAPRTYEVAAYRDAPCQLEVMSAAGDLGHCRPWGCTLDMGPDVDTEYVGQSASFSEWSLTHNGCTIDRADFTSDNVNIPVSPASSTTRPFITDATCNAAGSAQITAQILMNGVVECSDTSDMTCDPVQCSLSATDVTLARGQTLPGEVDVLTEVGGVVTEVSFLSLDTGVATVTSPDTIRDVLSPHFTTNITAVDQGTAKYRATGLMNDVGATTCFIEGDITVDPPSCDIEVNDMMVSVGDTLTGGTDWWVQEVTPPVGGVLDCAGGGLGVEFTVTSGSSYVNVTNTLDGNPDNPDCEPVYSVDIKGALAGTASFLALGTMDDGLPTTCQDTFDVVVYDAEWFQTQGGDLSADGDIKSVLPPLLPPDDVLIRDGADSNSALTRTAGVAVYNGSINTGAGQISSNNWQANSAYAGPTYDFAYFKSKVPSSIFTDNIPNPPIMDTADWSGGNLYNGYRWFFYDGSSGDLVINQPIDFGTDKVILFVENASLQINQPINLDDGQGFFMAIVEQGVNPFSGKIVVNEELGSIPAPGVLPHLEGIFIADDSFVTSTRGSGVVDLQLYLRGSVVANSFSLQRDLLSDNDTYPGEKIEFAPDLLFLYPEALSAKSVEWREVAP